MPNTEMSVAEPLKLPMEAVEKARKAVIADAGNDEVRVHFAQMLRAAGCEAQASFVEMQLKEVDGAIDEPISDPFRPYPNWTGFGSDLTSSGIRWSFVKGFAEHITCSAGQFLAVESRVSAVTPFRHLTLSELNEDIWNEVLRNSTFRNLRSLSLESTGLTDDMVKNFSAVKHPNLSWLSLAYNPVKREGVSHLACATATDRFPKLQFVSLLGCEDDPRQQLFYDQGVWVNSYFPKEGIELLAKFAKCGCNTIPWMFLTVDGKPRDVRRFHLAEVGESDPSACRPRARVNRASHGRAL
jgi:hypothetical protein